MSIAGVGTNKKYRNLAVKSNKATKDQISTIKDKIASNLTFLNALNPFTNPYTTQPPKVETPKVISENITSIDTSTINTSTIELPQSAPITPKLNTSKITNKITSDNDNTGNTGNDKDFSNNYLQQAVENKQISSKKKKTSIGLDIASDVANIVGAIGTYQQVKDSKSQYEQQKRIMDLNLKNQESYLLENYRSTIADLDATMAAKNVDLSSQGLQNLKEKGLMNIGEDIEAQMQQNSLNKAALDLQYAINKTQAKSEMQSNIISSAFNIGSGLLGLKNS